MRISWMMAMWPGVVFPNESILPVPMEEPNPTVHIHARQDCLVLGRFHEEVHGYQMRVDHDKRIITISSYFYARGKDPRSYKQLKAILRYWKKQNNRFVYQLGKGDSAIVYQIVFDIQEAKGTYQENGFFLPDPRINHQFVNEIQIVADGDMPEGCDEYTTVVGYSPENFIYIASAFADQSWVGIHEAGHRLGAGHNAGMMASNLLARGTKLSKKTVREILAGGHDEHTHRSLYAISPQNLQHIGRPPRGFYHLGKVKRKH